MKEQNLVTSTLILTATSFLTRTIGMISSVFLSQMLGTEGIGIYELIMSIYMTAVVFASAGLSASVSKMIAEELGRRQPENITSIMRTVFTFGIFTSLTAMTILIIGAPTFAQSLIHDTTATTGLRLLALSIPFMTCSSCFKGYFYATKKTVFPASADIIEQLVKVGLMITLVSRYAPLGMSYAYGAIGVGMTIGEITSWSYMLSLFILDRRKERIPNPSPMAPISTLRRLLGILLPIASIAYISYIFLSIENILIPSGLKKYSGTFSSSMSSLGMLKGMVFPILFFPSAFLTAFSTTLIPEIAKANILGHKKRVSYTTNRVLQLTFILSILVVSIFLTYGNELGFVIYKSDEIGPMLRRLSLIVPFMYTEVIADGILKGLGKQVSCLKYSLLDAVTRILFIYLLLPFKGVSALVLIMMMSCILTSTLNFNKLIESTKIKVHVLDWLIKPAIAGAFAGTYSRLIVNKLFRYSFGLTSKVLLGISICVLLYIPLLFLIQTLKSEDIAWLKKHLTFNKCAKKASEI